MGLGTSFSNAADPGAPKPDSLSASFGERAWPHPDVNVPQTQFAQAVRSLYELQSGNRAVSFGNAPGLAANLMGDQMPPTAQVSALPDATQKFTSGAPRNGQ